MSQPETPDQIFARALQHRDAGEYARALEILLSAEDALGEKAAFHAVVGHQHWRLEQHADAAAAFRRSLDIAPGYEKASLGLFHCLLHLQQVDAAFDEMRRFLSLRESPEYSRLLDELNAADS